MRSSRGCLPPGWCRIEVPRRVSNTSKKYDVYFYTKDGVKLRSFPEIKKYLEEKNVFKVERSCFNFIPLQTPVVRGFWDANRKLEHTRYLAENQERVKRLYSSDCDVLKPPDPHYLPNRCTWNRQDAIEKSGTVGNDTLLLQNSTESSKYSQFEVFTPADSLSSKTEDTLNIKELSTIKNNVVENHLMHDENKDDTQVLSSSYLAFNVDATTDHSNTMQGNFGEVHCIEKHASMTKANGKETLCSSQNTNNSEGAAFLSSKHIPYKRSKRKHNADNNASGVELLAKMKNKNSKKVAEEGKIVMCKRSLGDKRYLLTSHGNQLEANEIENFGEFEQSPQYHIPQRNVKGLTSLHQKQNHTISSMSNICVNNSHTRRNTKINTTTKLHGAVKLRAHERKDSKMAVGSAGKTRKRLYKRSYQLWLKCHRFSNTEKVHFIQKFNKNWSTSFITSCCGKLYGWTRIITQRQSGSTCGTWDVHYLSPRKERFRSKRAIEKYIAKNSININPELFCFRNNVFNFEMVESNRKCNSRIVKQQARSAIVPSSRIPNAQKGSKVQSTVNAYSIDVKQRSSKKSSSFMSTDTISGEIDGRHVFFRGQWKMSRKRLKGKVKMQDEDKITKQVTERNAVSGVESNCNENCTTELRLQNNFSAQVEESRKHSFWPDFIPPLKTSEYSMDKPIVRCGIKQDTPCRCVDMHILSCAADQLHKEHELALGILPENSKMDASKPNSNQLNVSRYFIGMSPPEGKESRSSQEHPLGQTLLEECNGDSFDALVYERIIKRRNSEFSSGEESSKLYRIDQGHSSKQIDLDEIKNRELCSKPAQTIPNCSSKILTIGNDHERNKTSVLSAIEDDRFVMNVPHIDTKSSICHSKPFFQNIPSKPSWQEDARLSTVHSLENTRCHPVNYHQIDSSKCKEFTAFLPNSAFPKKLEHFAKHRVVESKVPVVEQEPVSTNDVILEQCQSKMRASEHLSIHKSFSYNSSDMRKNCFAHTKEIYSATKDSTSTANIITGVLPGNLKRKIKCNDKVLQFFNEKARYYKKQKVSTFKFIKRCYPEESNYLEISQTTTKPSMTHESSNDERPINGKEIVVSNALAEADCLELDTVSTASLHNVNISFSVPIHSIENSYKKLKSNYSHVTEDDFPNGYNTVTKQRIQEVKSANLRNDFHQNNDGFSLDVNLHNETSQLQPIERPNECEDQWRIGSNNKTSRTDVSSLEMKDVRQVVIPEDVKQCNVLKNQAKNDGQEGAILNPASVISESVEGCEDSRESNVAKETLAVDIDESVAGNCMESKKSMKKDFLERNGVTEIHLDLQKSKQPKLLKMHCVSQDVSQDIATACHSETTDIDLEDSSCLINYASENGRRRQRTGLVSPYFSKCPEPACVDQSADICAEYVDVNSHRIRKPTILQFDYQILEPGNLCCKCGCVVADCQAMQRLNMCEFCKSRRYSSFVKISHLKKPSRIHPYADDTKVLHSAARQHHSCIEKDLTAISTISMKLQLESLGLVARSASCCKLIDVKDVSCGYLEMHPAAFDSFTNYESKGVKSKYFGPKFKFIDSLKGLQHFCSQLPIIHRRLGIQRSISQSSKQLRKNLLVSPYLRIRKKNHHIKLLKEKKQLCCISHKAVDTKEANLIEEDIESSNSNSMLSLIPVSLEGACMLDKNKGGPGAPRIDFSTQLNSCSALYRREDITKNNMSRSTLNMNDEQAGRSSTCDDVIFYDEKDFNTVCSNADKAAHIDIVDNVDDNYNTDNDWTCSLVCDKATGRNGNKTLCSEKDSSDKANEVEAVVVRSENLTISNDYLYCNERVCTNGASQTNTGSLDNISDTRGNYFVLCNENNSVMYSGKQLRGKHTQVHYIPPRSPFCLMQEQLYENPWKLLIACLFLNRTTAKQVIPVIRRFFQLWPDPETTMHTDWHDIQAVIKPLGLSEVRARRIVGFSKDYVQKSWTYPIELYGIGKYGNDSYRIFCLGEWEDVQPTDYKLNLYHEWLVEQNRLGLL